MNIKEIAEQLTAIHAALVEKTGEQPFIPPQLVVLQNGKGRIDFYRAYQSGSQRDYLGHVSGETAEDCIKEAFRFIAKLPDHEAAAKREWHGKLGKVIDEGHALNIEYDVMQPLRDGSAAMSKNLLAAE